MGAPESIPASMAPSSTPLSTDHRVVVRPQQLRSCSSCHHAPLLQSRTAPAQSAEDAGAARRCNLHAHAEAPGGQEVYARGQYGVLELTGDPQPPARYLSVRALCGRVNSGRMPEQANNACVMCFTAFLSILVVERPAGRSR